MSDFYGKRFLSTLMGALTVLSAPAASAFNKVKGDDVVVSNRRGPKEKHGRKSASGRLHKRHGNKGVVRKKGKENAKRRGGKLKRRRVAKGGLLNFLETPGGMATATVGTLVLLGASYGVGRFLCGNKDKKNKDEQPDKGGTKKSPVANPKVSDTKKVDPKKDDTKKGVPVEAPKDVNPVEKGVLGDSLCPTLDLAFLGGVCGKLGNDLKEVVKLLYNNSEVGEDKAFRFSCQWDDLCIGISNIYEKSGLLFWVNTWKGNGKLVKKISNSNYSYSDVSYILGSFLTNKKEVVWGFEALTKDMYIALMLFSCSYVVKFGVGDLANLNILGDNDVSKRLELWHTCLEYVRGVVGEV